MELLSIFMFIVTFGAVLILPGPNSAFAVGQALKFGFFGSLAVPLGFMSATGSVEIPPDVYAWTAVFLLPLNSSLNPYLYTFSIARRRHKAKQLASTTSDSVGGTGK